MKKTIIISAVALCFSMAIVHGNTVSPKTDYLKMSPTLKVNSFCISIAKGDIETVKKLLSFGEDVNQKSYGMTPLMYAAKYNRTEILKLLIEKGADVNAKSDKNMTAIKYAELHGAKDAYVILQKALSEN